MAQALSRAAVLVGESPSGEPLDLPGPLVDIAGKPLIDHVLDRLSLGGISEAIVVDDDPTSGLGEKLKGRRHPTVRVVRRADGDRLTFSAVLVGAGAGPILMVTTHSLWLDGPTPTLGRLARFWDPERMDALVLAVSTAKACGGVGLGDFAMDALGRVTRLADGDIAPFYDAGVHVVATKAAREAGGLGDILQNAFARGRLYGLVHDGVWFHVGAPSDLAVTCEMLAEPEVRWVVS